MRVLKSFMNMFNWFRLLLGGVSILVIFEENSGVNVRSVHVVTIVKASRIKIMLVAIAGDIPLLFAKFDPLLF